RVTVDDAGSGFLDAGYQLDGYRRADRPNLRVSRPADRQYAVVWVENLDHTCLRAALGLAVRPVPPAVVVLEGFDLGDYEVTTRNTDSGTSIPQQQRCVDGHITLHVPTAASDWAFKVRRLYVSSPTQSTSRV